MAGRGRGVSADDLPVQGGRSKPRIAQTAGKANFMVVLNCYFEYIRVYKGLMPDSQQQVLERFTVKPLIKNTSKEFIKCRILHFLIVECC